MERKKVNIVILNYKGEKLLPKYLPSVLESAKASRHECRVTVLENCSPDDSARIVRENFPEAGLVIARENRVLCSYNEFAEKSDDDILIFLNNDIQTDKGFVDPLIEPFLTQKDVFFVASHEDRAIPERRWGILSAEFSYPEYAEACRRPGFSFSAGIGAFDRKKFLELGGYDPMFLPGRYEDVDLCYRGWKKGWIGVYAPDARKFHEGGTSFNEKFGSHGVQVMVFRNSLLFTVKNVRDAAWLAEFVFFLLVRLLTAPFLGKRFVWEGFGQFLKRLPVALEGRRAERKRESLLSDRQVVQLLKEDLCVKR